MVNWANLILWQRLKKHRKRLERSSLRDCIIIGAIDIFLSLKQKKIVGWQLHLHLLVEGKNCPELQESIEAIFPPEATASKPYVFGDVADPERAVAHLYKPNFFRRSWYRVQKTAGAAKLPLTAGDLQELLSFLRRYQVGARFFVSGMRGDGKSLVSGNKK